MAGYDKDFVFTAKLWAGTPSYHMFSLEASDSATPRERSDVMKFHSYRLWLFPVRGMHISTFSARFDSPYPSFMVLVTNYI